MKPGRAFSLLAGAALLGAIAQFNKMTPDAQASLLIIAEAVRGTMQSLLQSAGATNHDVTNKTAGAAVQERPAQAPSPAPAAEDLRGGETLPRRIAARTADAKPPAPAGNPLWALPLEQLSITRERPIFAPSRRPPRPALPTYVAPVAVRQAIKPPEPERPAVSLLGTIIGTDDQIGVFLDTTRNVVRLRVGEVHRGWVLRLVKAREVTLVKDGEQAVVLELPPPGEAPAVGGSTVPQSVPGGLSGVSTGTIPIISRDNSADEQPVRSTRAARRQGR
jgi:hypothetical protein